MPHSPQIRQISEDLREQAVTRAREQEEIYGHNTGHFTLNTEKENTIIGTLGELVAREALSDLFSAARVTVAVELSDLGNPVDLVITGARMLTGAHVKTGLWKSWPSPQFAFGVHADQQIQTMNHPLVLVSLLKIEASLPKTARIEGFVEPDYLRECPIVQKGQRFPGSGVVSRTTNIVTLIGDYKPLNEISDLK